MQIRNVPTPCLLMQGIDILRDKMQDPTLGLEPRQGGVSGIGGRFLDSFPAMETASPIALPSGPGGNKGSEGHGLLGVLEVSWQAHPRHAHCN